jgi:hypothetical protein
MPGLGRTKLTGREYKTSFVKTAYLGGYQDVFRGKKEDIGPVDMARAQRHYIPGQVCEESELSLLFTL